MNRTRNGRRTGSNDANLDRRNLLLRGSPTAVLEETIDDLENKGVVGRVLR